jgi:excisionase family DNA binding protein
MTVEEAGEKLGISRSLAYAGVANGTIPSVRVGRRILVPTGALLAMLGTVNSSDPEPAGASVPGR